MNKLIGLLKKNRLLKIASLNSFAVTLRIVFGFLTSKLIAVFIGPEGFALLGNFKNFLTPVQSISTLGISSAIVKYVSEFKNRVFQLSTTLSSVVYLVAAATLILSCGSFFFSKYLSELLLNGSTEYAYIFKLLALALPFFSFQAVVVAIYNGLSRFKTVLTISIIGQVLVGVFTLLMIWKHQLFGAILALAIGEALGALIVVFWIIKDHTFMKLISYKRVSRISLGNLGTFAIMALFSSTIVPIVMILIRQNLINTEGITTAGYWDAMTRISSFYLMFTTSLMALYLLPKYAEIHSDEKFRNTLLNYYKTILPIVLLGLISVYVFRIYIIKIVLTEEFIEVQYLFKWQLVGDFLKIIATSISYQMIAKKMFWVYIITEATSVVFFFLLSVYLIKDFGVEGVTMAHALNYTFYLLMILVVFSKSLGITKKS